MESKRTCPECNLVFEAPLPSSGVLTCPLCNSTFALQPPGLPTPAAAPTPRPDLSGRQVLRGVGAVAALMFVVGGLVYAYHLMENLGHKTVSTPVPATNAPPASGLSPAVEIIPPAPSTMVRRPRPPSPPPELQPLAMPEESRRPLTLAERVNLAIDRGVAYLRKYHGEHNEYRRYLGLLGLTLLECGFPAADPSVQQIAGWIRAQERDLMQTYDLTLAILFLDRLGDPRDRPLIRTFGQRLLAGQQEGGVWTYSCLINNRLYARRNSPSGIASIPPMPSWPNASGLGRHPARQRIVYYGDNSNTQFAILGLWVAQRHGVPARAALLTTEQYFRETQQSGGSWAYHPNANNWRDSMTCAGLMSLAMRYGVASSPGRDIRPEHRVRVHDTAVQQGLRYLAQSLDKITLAGNRIVGAEARDPLYFLWSLERMAVIYDLKKIGNKEWYPWAAQMLVETQWADGRWPGMGDVVGTCFALLILKRSNFAQDLQLAVQEPPARPLRESMGPTIVQGRDAVLGLTGKPSRPPAMQGTAGKPASSPALGPSISRTPANK